MFLIPFAPTPRGSSPLTRSFERLFDDSFNRLSGYGSGSDVAQRSPAFDVTETERGYTRHCRTAQRGQRQPEDRDRRLPRQRDAQALREETKKGGERVTHRDRAAASFTLLEEVDQEWSQAKLDQGVLWFTLAKKRAAAARQVAVS